MLDWIGGLAHHQITYPGSRNVGKSSSIPVEAIGGVHRYS